MISIFVGYYRQKFLKYLHSYITSSTDLVYLLRKLHLQDNSTLLATSDTTSMYSNIEPLEGLETIKNYIEFYVHEVNEKFPTKLILKLLELVMTNNIFQFGNTYWKQLIGTAMGTPCACIYAILFFAFYERTHLQEKYKRNIITYVRAIDDILIV